MGMRMPETCWAVFKRRAINLRDWCIWLVDLFECMMMHGLTTTKFTIECLMKFIEGRWNASTSVYTPESISYNCTYRRLMYIIGTWGTNRPSVVLPETNHFNDRPIAEHVLAMGGVRSSQRCWWICKSFGILRRVDWQIGTDLSKTVRSFETSVSIYQWRRRNIP